MMGDDGDGHAADPEAESSLGGDNDGTYVTTHMHANIVWAQGSLFSHHMRIFSPNVDLSNNLAIIYVLLANFSRYFRMWELHTYPYICLYAHVGIKIYVVMSLVACAPGLPCWCSWPQQLITGEYSYLDLGHFWAVIILFFGDFSFWREGRGNKGLTICHSNEIV